MIDQMVQRAGSYYHLFPTGRQGKRAIWEGVGKDGFPYLKHFPNELVVRKNDQEMLIEIKGERGNSIYQVIGTDKGLDYLRGTNPVGVIFDEYSRMSPAVWDTMRPILRENEGFAIFAYTPCGMNHGFDLFNMAKENDNWFASLLTVDDTGIVSEADIEEERKSGMLEEYVQQEFYCSFTSSLAGAYFAKEMQKAEDDGRVCNVPYEPDLPVTTFWDLGINDSTAIIFAQILPHETRIIDFYENSGEGLTHYIKMLKEKPYVYGEHYAPHDIAVREFTTGRSRRDTALSLGVDFLVGQRIDKSESIDSLRRYLSRCWFDREKCNVLVSALMNYRKSYDERNKTYRSTPVHDWSSHACDSAMLMANSFYQLMGEVKHQNNEFADTGYDVFNSDRNQIFSNPHYDIFEG